MVSEDKKFPMGLLGLGAGMGATALAYGALATELRKIINKLEETNHRLSVFPTTDDIRKAIREEALRKRGIRPSVALADDIRSMFYCWVRKPIEEYAEAFIPDDPEKYLKVDWRETSYTVFAEARFVKPPNVITVSLRSKEVFRYGYFSFETTLPPATSNGPLLWFGFETDDLFRGGVAHFCYNVSNGKLFAYVGSNNGRIAADITGFLPSNYTTTRVTYSIRIKRNMVLHLINGKIVCITITGVGDSPFSSPMYTGAPYIIAKTQDSPPTSMPVLIDIDGGDTSVEWTWNNVHPWLIRVSDGEPDTAIIMPLFLSGTYTLLRDYTLSSGSVTSAPIPGVGKKTIQIRADTSGTVELQAYTYKGWATYDTYQLQGGKWLMIKPEEDAEMFRIIYTPTSYPATIIDTNVFII